jgi:hypothetical protein
MTGHKQSDEFMMYSFKVCQWLDPAAFRGDHDLVEIYFATCCCTRQLRGVAQYL